MLPKYKKRNKLGAAMAPSTGFEPVSAVAGAPGEWRGRLFAVLIRQQNSSSLVITPHADALPQFPLHVTVSLQC